MPASDELLIDVCYLLSQTSTCNSDCSEIIHSYFLPQVGYVSGTTPVYYHENRLGSNVAEVDTHGAQRSETEYTAYGEELPFNVGPRSQFRFAGKHGYQSEPDTGLDLLGHRYYAPKLGRFLTQDPIGHEGGLNLYSYCDNNPLAKVDPAGKQSALNIDSVSATISRALVEATKSPQALRNAIDTLRGLAATGGLSKVSLEQVNRALDSLVRQVRLLQSHHYLPEQFRKWFEAAPRSFNIDAYTKMINAEWHRIIHGKLVETGINYGP